MSFGIIRREDTSMLGTQEIGVPSQLSSAAKEQVDAWLMQRHNIRASGKPFRNYTNHFLLDWNEIDIPDPMYMRRDQDLCLIAFPEVQSPHKFPEKVYTYDNKTAEKLSLTPSFTIKPPLYSDELILLNPDVEVRKIKSGYYSIETDSSGIAFDQNYPVGSFIPRGHFGVRTYSSASAINYIPVVSKRPGSIYCQPTGVKLMSAPISWMADYFQNGVFGPDYSGYLSEFGIDPSSYDWDDDFWMWYWWGDGADDYRKQWWDQIQKRYVPRRGEGFSMLLSDVRGLSQGGNNGKSWIDPIYLDNISKVNFHKQFREVSHCYNVDKCNYASGLSPRAEVQLIERAGFKKNKFAGLGGEPFCNYRQSEPDSNWKSRDRGQFGDWDKFCKFVGIPQRAVEFDGHYKILLNDILWNFRKHGMYYWTGYASEDHPCKISTVSNGFKVYCDQTLQSSSGKFVFGQLNEVLGVGSSGEEKDIPAGTVLFFFSGPLPEITPFYFTDNIAGYEEHKNSHVFAYIWQQTNVGMEKWLVELKDDYISPAWRISEFEVAVPISGGENPFIRDRKTTGKNNGGMRPYLIQDPDSGEWIISPELYDINSRGFFNISGGQVQIGGSSAEMNEIGISSSPPSFIDVPSVLSYGWVKAVGLPGEIIQRDSVFWNSPTVVKWDHIQELKDRLLVPSKFAAGYPSSMRSDESGEEVIPTPNHILVGEIEHGERGTGMVAGGETQYSDIVLQTDICHARNMAMPMIACVLSSLGPDSVPSDFDHEVQDFATRLPEPNHLTIKRYGFREPAIRTFMKNIYGGKEQEEDVSYTAMVPVSQNPIFDKSQEVAGPSPSGANSVYRIFHPNGMRWWRDNGLLGCGIQWGTPSEREEIGAKGSGLTQVGVAMVNLFRKMIPLDKEVVAAYLSLVPSTSLTISSSVVRTAGGGTQWTIGNSPFHNTDVLDPNNEILANLYSQVNFMGIPEYEYKLYYKEEHQGTLTGYTYNERREFCKLKKVTEVIVGQFGFPFTGDFDLAGPVSFQEMGKTDGIWGFFNKWDYEKTKRGNILKDIQIEAYNRYSDVISGKKTKQRSQRWYDEIIPSFMQGVHSKTDCLGINTRKDYDENGSINGPSGSSAKDGVGDTEGEDRGLGFKCSDSGWGKDHRIIDLTDAFRKAYYNDRFNAKYTAQIDRRISDLGERYDLVVLKPAPPVGYIEFGSLPVNQRITYETSPGFFSSVIEQSQDWGSVSESHINSVVIDLKQIPPPRKIEGVSVYEESGLVASEREMRQNAIVSGFLIEFNPSYETPEGEPAFVHVLARSWDKDRKRFNGWKLIETKSQVVEKEGYDINIDKNLDSPMQIRQVRVITNMIMRKVQVLGWMTEDFPGQVPMTEPAIVELHKLSNVIIERERNTYDGDYSIAFLEFPATKIYKVSIIPYKDSDNLSESGLSSLSDGACSIDLSYSGLFNYLSPPQFSWEVEDENTENQRWTINQGNYAYSPSMNAIILPTLEKWVEILVANPIDPNSTISKKIKVSDIKNLAVSIEYITSRGAKAILKIRANHSGPAYDVDPESICEITEEGVGMIGGTQVENPLPWSVSNPLELQGGYVEGVLPTNANGSLEALFGNTKNNRMWIGYCRGIVELWGEPDQLINGGEFLAPSHIIEKDPVSGDILSNGFIYSTDIDENKIPNGGRTPGSLTIKLYSSDGDDNSYEDSVYRKKQAAYTPYIYVYLRERIPNWSKEKAAATNWGLSFL